MSDFPKKGVSFKDITPLLKNSNAFKTSINIFKNRIKDKKIDAIVALDARGFIFGAALAYELNLPFIPIRKAGKLPNSTLEQEYDLEYGSACLQIHKDALLPDQKVVLIDDVLATGGTAQASIKLLRKLEVQIVEVLFLINLTFLNGEEKINAPIFSILEY
ncbi:MAG: adenine phosphoribosyltransferase [Candidatus Gracilibacteria bacterium]|nr:adenine phosphoribosyltransferase [Candidatus Gracilibacteria bacterium]